MEFRSPEAVLDLSDEIMKFRGQLRNKLIVEHAEKLRDLFEDILCVPNELWPEDELLPLIKDWIVGRANILLEKRKTALLVAGVDVCAAWPERLRLDQSAASFAPLETAR